MSRIPATVDDVKKIVENDLARCNNDKLLIYKKYAVAPYLAPIVRNGKLEMAVVVARKGQEVIYWEDVEEGFNISPVDNDGKILNHLCNQDDLPLALDSWMKAQPNN